MRIVIISDIHGNLAALQALPEARYDQLWCLGDLVNYGPKPHEIVQWIKGNANVVVRGNHDNAVGFNVDPQCSPPFKRLAEATMRFTQSVCSNDDTEYLRSLPIQTELNVGAVNFYLVHATPTDPLFGYCPEDSERWEKEIEWIRSDVLVVGHTHTPFIRKVKATTIVNPGSLGQPKTGRPHSCYAIWEDGDLSLKEYEYPLIDTENAVRDMPLAPEDQEALITVLKTGASPVLHESGMKGNVL
jgi:putative phosphoesterase